MGEQDSRNRSERLLAARRWLRRNWTDDAILIWRRSAVGQARGRALWVGVLLFLRESWREVWRSQVTARAGSLSYATLLSLIPLLVAFSQILRSYFVRALPDFGLQLDAILTMILPYRSAEVTGQIQTFVENAQTASTLGAVVFVVIAFRLFMAVEGTINNIWKVQAGRSWRQQFRAFTMIIFWGPLLIAGSFATSASLERSPWVGQLIRNELVIRIVPTLVLFVAFTMLFWLVPATRVKFASAAIAGAITAVLFDLVRFGFGLYADTLATGRLNVIYGTLGLLIIFLLALELMWVIVLTGVVMSYVHQNFEGIIRAAANQLEEDPSFDTYFALRALIEIVEKFSRREDAPSSYRLAQALNATDEQMLRILRALEDARIVKEIGGDWTGWVPGADPESITVAEVVATMEQQTAEIPHDEAQPDKVRLLLNSLLEEHKRCRSESLDRISLAELARRAVVEEPVTAPLRDELPAHG